MNTGFRIKYLPFNQLMIQLR